MFVWLCRVFGVIIFVLGIAMVASWDTPPIPFMVWFAGIDFVISGMLLAILVPRQVRKEESEG